MSEPVPALVTLHVWRVPARGVPAALARVARDRRALRRVGGLRFFKLLGTGDGRTFDPRDATATRWALLATWDTPPAAAAFDAGGLAGRWHAAARERCRIDLAPLSGRGRWSGRAPFGEPAPRPTPGPVAALTRARLRLRAMPAFYRAVPAVARDLQARPGLRLALGIGEAPVGFQGTFSVWESAQALTGFAVRGEPHGRVVRRSAAERWYAEELFARFAVLGADGTIDGRPVG